MLKQESNSGNGKLNPSSVTNGGSNGGPPAGNGQPARLPAPEAAPAPGVHAGRSADRRLHSIIETAGEAFVSIDEDGLVTEWNPQAESIFGWSRDEALGRPLAATIIPPRHRKAHLRGLARFLATGQGSVLNKRMELTALHRAGHEFPVELTISAIREAGQWTFNAFLHDISERRRAEDKLKKSELRLAQAQQVARIGSWEWDIELDLVSWSDQLYRTFGLDPESFGASYRAFLERVHPADRDRVDGIIRRALADQEPFDFHHRIVRPDGTVRVLHGQGEVVTDDDGRPVKMYGTGHDVTEQKELEEEIELFAELALAIGEAETVEAALEFTLRRICEKTGWIFGQAWLRNGSLLECNSAWYSGAEGLEPFRRRSESMTFERGSGLPGEAFAARRPVWMSDVKTNARFTRTAFARQARLGAGLAVPVIAGDEVVAVMEFYVSEGREEDERFVALVSTLAAQLGSLIERKQAEEALRKNEECFRSLVESFDDQAICMLDSSGHVISWNRGAERITGYRSQDVLGYHLSRLYTPEAVAAGEPERHLEIAASRGHHEASGWRVRRDGLRFWATVTLTPLRGDDGEIRGYSHVARDTTERKQSEEELQRLGSIVEDSEDAIIGATLETGIVTTWNRGAERLLGYSAREIIGRSLRILVPAENAAAQDDILEQLARGMRIEHFETSYVRKNGAVVDVSLTVSPVRDLAGSLVGLSAIARDITERTQAQRALEHALGTYLDRDVVDHILTEGPSPDGEEVDVTMMFIDICDFMEFSSRYEPQDVIATLNCLFELAVPIIARYGGHVDKFTGDGLLAVFGAPVARPDHACRALQAALEISESARERFQGDLELGIGIDSGPAVAGNVGGGGRLDFTVIGDAVNMASRVEAATRQTEDTVLITEATRERVGNCAVAIEERPDIRIKGKREPVVLYAPRKLRRRDEAEKEAEAAAAVPDVGADSAEA